MIKNSFTLRVLVISFLVLALPLLVDSFIFFQNSYYDSIKDAKRDLREVANFRTYALSEIQPVKQVLLRELDYILKLSEQIDDPDQEQLTRRLSEVAHIGGEFQIYLLSIGDGPRYKILASSVHTLVNTFFTSYLRLKHVLNTGEGSFIRYVYSRDTQSYIPYVFVARVINSAKTGKPAGIIMVTADIQNELDSVLAKADQSDNIQFAILNSDGIVFAATKPGIEGQYFDPLAPVRRKEIIDSGLLGTKKLPKNSLPIIRGDDPPFFEFIFNDQVQIAYRAYIPRVGISVIAFAPKEEFFGKAVRHFLLIYTIYGLILVVGGGVTYWLSLWISRPLRQLSFLMGEVSRGNLDVRFKEEPLGFEINILGRIFNNTIDNLLQTIQQAEDERVKKETYQKELAIGRKVQRSLLPSVVPKIEGAEVAGTYLSAIDVGGDFYGYLPKQSSSGDEELMLMVADAAGRGISSCLYALSARSLFRANGTLYDTPGEVLSHTNNAFLKDAGDTGMFLTALLGVYHVKSKLFTYYSCGHVPAIVRRNNGQIITLTHAGLALGLKEVATYPTDSIQLESKDTLIMYTDGLLKAVNDKNQPFTEKRLRHLLQTKQWNSAQEAVEAITAELKAFTRSVPQEEEVIILALRVT